MLVDAGREDLLDDLMDALNALAGAGCPVSIRDGCLESHAGTLLPRADGRWSSQWPGRPPVPSSRPLVPEHLDRDG
jgi:hypothetical protein